MIAELKSNSVEETEGFGAKLGTLLQPGDFVGLAGDLGAGKTAFVRGVARGVGIPKDALVSSPTFAIVNAYHGGRVPVFHADLYRVEDAEELYDAGFYDLMESGGAMLVEWIDRVPDVTPEQWLEINIRKVPGGRVLAVEGHGSRAAEIVSALR